MNSQTIMCVSTRRCNFRSELRVGIMSYGAESRVSSEGFWFAEMGYGN